MSDLLKAGPNVKILVTSRARLNLQSEHPFPVVGMDCPALTLVDVAQYSAVQLFLSSARRVQPGLELTADDLADVARTAGDATPAPKGKLRARGPASRYSLHVGAEAEAGTVLMQARTV